MRSSAHTPTTRKVQHPGEVERVYRQLKAWLVQAKLAPGEVLSELDLAQRCKTSRTPVREAFSRLAQDGWLRRIPHKGYLVAPISIREIVELYEYRKILECFAAERVAQSGDHQAIEELAKIMKVEKDRKAPLPDILAANSEFHARLAELSLNQRVASQVSLMLSYVRRLDTICTQKVPGWIGHDEILAALQLHQPPKARLAMARHIDLSRDKMLRLFGA